MRVVGPCHEFRYSAPLPPSIQLQARNCVDNRSVEDGYENFAALARFCATHLTGEPLIRFKREIDAVHLFLRLEYPCHVAQVSPPLPLPPPNLLPPVVVSHHPARACARMTAQVCRQPSLSALSVATHNVAYALACPIPGQSGVQRDGKAKGSKRARTGAGNSDATQDDDQGGAAGGGSSAGEDPAGNLLLALPTSPPEVTWGATINANVKGGPAPPASETVVPMSCTACNRVLLLYEDLIAAVPHPPGPAGAEARECNVAEVKDMRASTLRLMAHIMRCACQRTAMADAVAAVEADPATGFLVLDYKVHESTSACVKNPGASRLP
jgi:hypothetical protein